MVPKGWEAIKLNDICDKVTSGSRNWAQYYSEEGSKFIRMTNLQRNSIYLDLSDLKFVDIQDDSSDGKRTSLEAGDILMSITAELGKIGWVHEGLGESFINQHTALIRLKENKSYSKYIAYLLSSREMNHRINRLNDSGAKAGLNLTTIRSIPLAIPPIQEQQKIAKILSTWDKAISTTERLIDNSTQQKKALMQQLLTGKKRLLDDEGKRFAGEWEELKLENVFKLSSGDTKPKDVENEPTDEQKIPVFGGNNIMGYSANSNSEGDVILIGRVGEYCGVTRLIQEKCWITDNALFTKEFSNDFDRFFIVYLLQNFQLSRLRNKGGQPQISQKPIYNLKLKIPLLKEQQKIATVLTNADKEIELLEQQLADLQQEKKALMQVLLTGKKRVKLND